MNNVKLNPTLACFLRFVGHGYYGVGDVVWSTRKDGSKRLTKTQFKSLEKKGLIELEWKEDHAVLKSCVRVISIKPIGSTPPYKVFIVSYH